jgi:hypothetical protein
LRLDRDSLNGPAFQDYGAAQHGRPRNRADERCRLNYPAFNRSRDRYRPAAIIPRQRLVYRACAMLDLPASRKR